MNITPDYVGDVHQRVIDHNNVVVNRHAAGAKNDGIADHFVRELHVPVHDVMESNRVLRDLQAYGAKLSSSPAPLSFHGIQALTLAGIDGLAAFGQRLLALFLQLFVAAETQIGLAFTYQPFCVLAIDMKAVRLPIRNIRAADVRTLVPIQAKPFQITDELILEARLTAFDIGVFHAQDHRAALL